MVKVSVVIPTYRSGPGLDRVVESLDAQSLDQSEFEVLLLDDGSGDGTADRLRAIAATRPNYHVHELPHSGWPSHPRNIGVQRATGDYVLFMDHDDALYPRALRQAHGFAAKHALDVLNAREISYSAGNWSWMEYNSDDGGDTRDPELLIPMMPHKLYRREFLVEHSVAFREGAGVHWEDRIFNVDAYAAAERVGRLSSVPFYQWHTTDRNSSASYVGDPRGWNLETYWPVMVDLHDHFARQLGPADLLAMRKMDYLARVLLTWVGPRTLNLGRELSERSRELMQPFLAAHAPPELDEGLPAVLAARSHLLRTRQNEAMWELAEVDTRVWAKTEPVTLSWEGGRPVLTSSTTWRVSGDNELGLERVGDRLRRRLSPSLVEALPPELVDVTDQISEARTVFALREATELCPYPLTQTTSAVVLGGTDDKVTVTLTCRVAIDTRTAIMGRPIGAGRWHFALRCDFIGYFHRKPVTFVGRRQHALSHGRIDLWAADENGVLTLTRRKNVRGLLSTIRFASTVASAVSVTRVGARSNRIRIDLPQLPSHGSTTIPCLVLLTGEGGVRVELPGQLRGNAAGAWIGASGRIATGRYRIAVSYGGELVETRLALTVDVLRRARVTDV